MAIERFPDVDEYARAVTPLLMRDEPRFNLELAIVNRLVRRGSYGDSEPVLLVVDGAPALMTPPFNLLVAAVPPSSAAALADYVHAGGHHVPGVLGGLDTTGAFAARYESLTGRAYDVTREQGVYVLRTLVPPRPAPGALRTAGDADWDLVLDWVRAFQDEVGLPPHDASAIRARLDEGMVWLWEDGSPVSLVGCGGFTPTGARIGPVYTPPGLRGRGYASAATAAVTQELLDRGRACTFLYTDLANPTSNKIYRDIGYEHVTDVREVSFDG